MDVRVDTVRLAKLFSLHPALFGRVFVALLRLALQAFGRTRSGVL